MVSFGIPLKIVRLFKELYSGGSIQVQVNGALSEEFTINTGVKQGCILSPSLFNFVVDYVLKKTFGILHYNDFTTSDVDFADDIALTAKDANSAQLILKTLSDVAKCFGLRVNASKTKALFINCDESRLLIDDKPLENVKYFVYQVIA